MEYPLEKLLQNHIIIFYYNLREERWRKITIIIA